MSIEPARVNVDATLLIGFYASAVGDLDTVMRVVQTTGLDQTDIDGRTLLHIACCKGQLHVAEFLIDQKADVSTADHRGVEPLVDSMLGGHADIASLLLRAGAQLSDASARLLHNRLCEHAAQGDVPAFRALADAGVAVNALSYDRRSPLHLAAAAGHLGLARLILARGGDPHRRDRHGRTPVSDAIAEGHADVEAALRLAALPGPPSDSDGGGGSDIADILDGAGLPPPSRPRSLSPPSRPPSGAGGSFAGSAAAAGAGGARKLSSPLEPDAASPPPQQPALTTAPPPGDMEPPRFTTHCAHQARTEILYI